MTFSQTILFFFALQILFYLQVLTNTSNILHNNEQTGSSLFVRLCQVGGGGDKERIGTVKVISYL